MSVWVKETADGFLVMRNGKRILPRNLHDAFSTLEEAERARDRARDLEDEYQQEMLFERETQATFF